MKLETRNSLQPINLSTDVAGADVGGGGAEAEVVAAEGEGAVVLAEKIISGKVINRDDNLPCGR